MLGLSDEDPFIVGLIGELDPGGKVVFTPSCIFP
jgi:hypothetical protein